LDPYPIAGLDIARGRGIGVDVDLWVHGAAAKAGQTAVLAFAKERVLGASQDQRIARREPGLGTMADKRFLVIGQWRGGKIEQGFWEKIELARRGVGGAWGALPDLGAPSVSPVQPP